MLFSSTLFLFVFLPAVILCYYGQKSLIGNRFRNACLLLFSYLFYLFGAAGFALGLMASTVVDFVLGMMIDRYRRYAKTWVMISILINIGSLIYFKYSNFIIAQTNPLLHGLGHAGINRLDVILPLGISFFTFQKISYIIDVYRRHARAMTNIIDFSLYVAMFPQLVAGPIVRFKNIWDQIKLREETWECFYAGCLRFCWGLGKKVLIADACGQIADSIFSSAPDAWDMKTAWLGAVAYTMQIYFDFSAYSDMALGLGRMFGFSLKENFKSPYAATSITDFWRRWHISLSSWFRDYLYIPLGGNRKGAMRTYANLLIVFSLCGLWHGADWTFIAWGLYHGFFLIVERLAGIRNWTATHWIWTRRTVTMLIVIFGWVLFRSETLDQALAFMQAMVVYNNLPVSYELIQVLHWRNVTFMAVGFIGVAACPYLPSSETFIQTKGPVKAIFSAAMILAMLPYCAIVLFQVPTQPFIYFRF